MNEHVEIFQQNDDAALRERPASAAAIFDALTSLPADFMEAGRNETAPQEREFRCDA